MKRIAFLLSIITLSSIIISCSTDNNKEQDIISDNNYKFSFSVGVVDFDGKYILSNIKSDDNFCTDDISIKPLKENDNVSFETIVDQTTYSASIIATETNNAKLLVNVESQEPDGIITHKFVIQWDKNNSKITDTITYEIEKKQNNISCKNLFVNNTQKRLTDNNFPQFIYITKITPAVYNLLDKNNNEAFLEKEIDGIKISFWLSDMDDKTTNVFDEKDISERGFNFNLSFTNNSDRNIFITNDVFGSYLSNVFNDDNNYIGRTCLMFQAILAIYKIQPGETYHESLLWCGYDVNTPDINPLPAGKYYTYYCKKFTYESGENYDIDDYTKTNTTTKTIEIPYMFINFEVK